MNGSVSVDLATDWSLALLAQTFDASRPALWLADGLTYVAVVGSAWGRWPFPPAPRHVPGVPRGYLVEARKR